MCWLLILIGVLMIYRYDSLALDLDKPPKTGMLRVAEILIVLGLVCLLVRCMV